jgi:transcriptional regulator with XRE-family HTH domain
MDAQNLRERREILGLSQKKLAELAGISEVMVGRYENHQSKPTVKTITKLETALKGLTLEKAGERWIRHSFRLRPNGEAIFELPPDLTNGEAERLASFIRSLPL